MEQNMALDASFRLRTDASAVVSMNSLVHALAPMEETATEWPF